MFDDFKAMSRYYAEHASLGDVMGDIIAITVGAILIASMLPTALSSFYKVNTGWFVYGGASTGTNCRCSNVTQVQTILPPSQSSTSCPCSQSLGAWH